MWMRIPVEYLMNNTARSNNHAHAGSRTRVTSMGGLYDAATLRAQVCVVRKRVYQMYCCLYYFWAAQLCVGMCGWCALGFRFPEILRLLTFRSKSPQEFAPELYITHNCNNNELHFNNSDINNLQTCNGNRKFQQFSNERSYM